MGRTTGAVVGRRDQLEAVERELGTARSGLVCLAIEGEPGIGKTRFLLAVEEMARIQGFVSVAVTADEEIRGPFLVARSLFASPDLSEAVSGSAETERRLRQVLDVLLNQDDPSLAQLPSEQRLLRIFDLAAVALRELATYRPIALLLDDVQWADEDSVRLIRYLIRPNMRNPVFMIVAGRREEMAAVPAVAGLLADLDRMGVLRRFGLSRLTQPESAELLRQTLGGEIDLSSAAVMHGQSEGVPFVLTEQVRAYREAGLLHPIDGVWTLARNAERLLPSAVRTLIQRREARLPDDVKQRVSDAAALGRNFSLRDLREVLRRLGQETTEAQLADALSPAVAAGFLIQHPDGAAADYGFTHGQVREFAAARLSPPRRRAIHSAVVDMLTAGGEPAAASLPLIARHAVAAGRTEFGARMSIKAAKAALVAHAPEEALRLIETAHPIASEPEARVALLRLRDEALTMLRRPKQQLDGLAELAALADALGDPELELEVPLRRAAALRRLRDWEGAGELARHVRKLAAGRGDRRVELAAALELGQDLLRADLGEAYNQSPAEADLEAAEEAFRAAAGLAREIGDDRSLAAATREIGIVLVSHMRRWIIDRIGSGEYVQFQARMAAGESIQELLESLPSAHLATEAIEYLRQALELYEQLDDRQGVMSTVIAMAVVNWAPEIHLVGSAKRIEELHRLMTRLKSFTTESQRALAEAQMLFGSHVYARAKIFPDVAITKGEEAYTAARALGDRSLEFAVAGSLSLAYLELNDTVEASRWLDRAAELAAGSPSPLRARQVEFWRGVCAAGRGDAVAMRTHLETAARLASDHGRVADRCQVLARMALEAARLGTVDQDEELLGLAEHAAREVKKLLPVLSGRPPWGAEANAALARVELSRGKTAEAAAHGEAALAYLDRAVRDDAFLDVVLPAAAAVLAGGGPETVEAAEARLRLLLSLITQRIADPEVRVRWFRAPLGRELARLAGPVHPSLASSKPASETGRHRMTDEEGRLLQLLSEGRTNEEIAQALGVDEDVVARRLTELYVRIGVTSRADATAHAFITGMV